MSLHYTLAPDIRVLIEDRAWLHEEEVNRSRIEYIVGIDYGTTFSGFGVYQVPKHSKSLSLHEPLKIRTQHAWPNQPPGVSSAKLPTVTSYTKSSYGFRDFGWSATYDDAGHALKFSLIKLAFSTNTVSGQTGMTLPKPLSLVHLVADFLSCLVSHIKEWVPSIHVLNTMWCFTVPMSWQPDTTVIMSQAASLAGMVSGPHSPYLKFCFEPEAVSLSCIHEHIDYMHPGTTFLVVDAGGGSIETYHCKVGPHASLEEIWLGEGIPVGGGYVDALFYTFLRTHLGAVAMDKVFLSASREMAATRRDMEVRWEQMKRVFKGTPGCTWVLPLSNVVYEHMEEEKKQLLRRRQGTDTVLWVTTEDMVSFFRPLVEGIVEVVVNQLTKLTTPPHAASVKVVDALMVVGGLGCNGYVQRCVLHHPMVQERVHHRVKVPNPDHVVFNGGVRYMLSKNGMYPRIAKATLAMLVHVKKQPLEFPFVCIDHQTFYILLRQGDEIQTPLVHSHLALLNSSASGVIKLYEIREQHRPISVECIGKLAIYEPFLLDQEHDKKRRVTLLLHFGDTEMKCKVINESNGREWETTLAYDVTQTRIFNTHGKLNK